jgi:23S rRNA pseudouridine2605 synthase
VKAKNGDQIDAAVDEVRVNGRIVRVKDEPHVTIALNKPIGVVTTMRDERGRPCVGDLLRSVLGSNATPKARRLFPVGRLDAQTTGLLLCTSDGELARRLAHPSFEVPRRYRVEVVGVPAPDALSALEAQHARKTAGGARFEMTLTGGTNREIRRACAQHGLRVEALERIAYGPVQLGSLKPGGYRTLTEREVRELGSCAGG